MYLHSQEKHLGSQQSSEHSSEAVYNKLRHLYDPARFTKGPNCLLTATATNHNLPNNFDPNQLYYIRHTNKAIHKSATHYLEFVQERKDGTKKTFYSGAVSHQGLLAELGPMANLLSIKGKLCKTTGDYQTSHVIPWFRVTPRGSKVSPSETLTLGQSDTSYKEKRRELCNLIGKGVEFYHLPKVQHDLPPQTSVPNTFANHQVVDSATLASRLRAIQEQTVSPEQLGQQWPSASSSSGMADTEPMSPKNDTIKSKVNTNAPTAISGPWGNAAGLQRVKEAVSNTNGSDKIKGSENPRVEIVASSMPKSHKDPLYSIYLDNQLNKEGQLINSLSGNSVRLRLYNSYKGRSTDKSASSVMTASISGYQLPIKFEKDEIWLLHPPADSQISSREVSPLYVELIREKEDRTEKRFMAGRTSPGGLVSLTGPMASQDVIDKYSRPDKPDTRSGYRIPWMRVSLGQGLSPSERILDPDCSVSRINRVRNLQAILSEQGNRFYYHNGSEVMLSKAGTRDM